MNKTLLRVLLFIFIASLIVTAFFNRDKINLEQIQLWVEQAGILAPLIFVLLYCVATILFLPGSLLTLAGGLIFGPVYGVLYNLTGATLGACMAFLIARYLASDWVKRRTGGRLKLLLDGVSDEGWRFVAFVRLVPVFPFNLLNYALGLSEIRFTHYLLATYVCMFPGAVAYTYLGYAGAEAIQGQEGFIKTALIAIALFAVVAFIPGFVKRLRSRSSSSANQ